MVRSRANERPYRKRLCPTLPGHFASWIHTRGVVLSGNSESEIVKLARMTLADIGPEQQTGPVVFMRRSSAAESVAPRFSYSLDCHLLFSY
jgi:hypothetical protein